MTDTSTEAIKAQLSSRYPDGIIVAARIDSGAWVGRDAWIESTDHYEVTGYRKDGYGFTMYVTKGVVRVVAGCRDFTYEEAIQHWSSPEYRDRKLGDETLVILQSGYDILKLRGVVT